MKTLLPDLWTRDFMTDPFRALERDLFGRDFRKSFELPASGRLAAGSGDEYCGDRKRH